MFSRFSTDHVVCVPSSSQLTLTCLRCKAEEVVRLPVTLTTAATLGKDFTAAHRHCRKVVLSERAGE